MVIEPRSQVAFQGGFKDCSTDQRMDQKEILTCPEGFIPDEKSINCFMALNVVAEVTRGKDLCISNTILSFTNDNDVQGFMDLLSSGSL